MDHGAIFGKEYVFVPDAVSDSVYLFRDNARRPWTSLKLTSTQDVCGVAYKPAGVP
jgi:hypothetical protein